MTLGHPIGLVVFGVGVLLIGLVASFSIVLVLERSHVVSRTHRARWVLIITPFALAGIGVLGWVFI